MKKNNIMKKIKNIKCCFKCKHKRNCKREERLGGQVFTFYCNKFDWLASIKSNNPKKRR